MVGQSNQALGVYTGFALTIIAFFGTIASHFFITVHLGRRTVMVASAIIFFISNIFIMVGLLTSINAMVFAAMAVAIFFFGLTYATTSSIYPS